MALLCVAAAASLLLLPAATLGATAYVTCGSPIKLIHAGLGVKMLANEVRWLPSRAWASDPRSSAPTPSISATSHRNCIRPVA